MWEVSGGGGECGYFGEIGNWRKGVIVKCKGSHVYATSGGSNFFHLNAEPQSKILSLSL